MVYILDLYLQKLSFLRSDIRVFFQQGRIFPSFSLNRSDPVTLNPDPQLYSLWEDLAKSNVMLYIFALTFLWLHRAVGRNIDYFYPLKTEYVTEI